MTGVAVKFAAEADRARTVLGVDPVVIPNGLPVLAVPPARLRPAPPPGAPVVFGTLARLAPDKRLDVLITAAARAATRIAPDLHFEVRIAGGPEPDAPDHADALRSLVAQHDAPVRFVGVVEAGAFLETLDAFVLVAEPEGCPNASLEAMAAGLPVAATAVGGVVDQLADGAGLLVPRGDVEALADALVRLATDAALRADLGHVAHARARVRYTLDAMVAAYSRLLDL